MKKALTLLTLALTLLCSRDISLAYAETLAGQPAEMRSETLENPWEFSTAVTVERGDFGTNTKTRTVYIPVTLKRYFNLGDIALTVPYTNSKGGSNVTTISGRSVQTRSGTGTNTSTGSIGDIVLAGSYYLLSEANDHPFDLSIIGNVKFPTADYDKGLGTGEFDETAGFSINKSLNDWLIFSNVYYTFIGDPSGLDLNDQLTYEVGGGYHVNPSTTINLSYQEKTAVLDGSDNPQDIILSFNYDIEKDKVILFGSATKGLSDGSPDYGFTLGLSSRF